MISAMDSPREIRFSQDHVIKRPPARGIYPISEDEWSRIRRMVRRLDPPKRIYQNLSSAAAGLCASATLSTIAFLDSPPTRSWVLPATIAAAGIGLILALVFHWVDRELSTKMGASKDLILEEMDLLEEGFGGSGSSGHEQALGRRERVEPLRIDQLIRDGWRVKHDAFGLGTVKKIEGQGDGRIAVVDFDEAGRKKILLKYGHLSVERSRAQSDG